MDQFSLLFCITLNRQFLVGILTHFDKVLIMIDEVGFRIAPMNNSQNLMYQESDTAVSIVN